MSSGVDASQLLDTLTLALTQCRDQVRVLSERADTVTRLQQENARLKQDLENALASLKQASIDSEHHQKLEELYQRDFDKQLQIDQLQEKLRQIKAKAKRQGLLHAIASSPLPPTSAVQPTLKHAAQRSEPVENDAAVPEEHSGDRSTATETPSRSELISAVPSKRNRTRSPPLPAPLSEVSGNPTISPKARSRLQEGRKRQRPLERITSAIPVLAEDGESQSEGDEREKHHRRPKSDHVSAYERLQDLMTLPTPLKTALAPPITVAQPSRQHAKHTTAPIKDEPPSSPAAISREPRRTLSSTRSKVLSPSPIAEPTEDDEPFRARPPQRLDLIHFKLNPAANAGFDYAYTEVVRGRQERRCLPGCTRAECCGNILGPLAATLPPRLVDQNMTAEDLLIGYLGPGSESRVKSLTPVARANLLHEAKLKLVADTYGKAHRGNTGRAASPPGYWSTDMPASQEYEDLRAQARQLERAEVMRRYNEAMKGNGKWLFADE